MSADAEEEKFVEERRVWLDKQLGVAARKLAVNLTGKPVNTFDMRSAGAVADDAAGGSVWLRVLVEDTDYQPQCRWTGNEEANAILGVAKPTLHRSVDWYHSDEYLQGRRLRGEVMTLAPGTTVAPGGVLLSDPQLPESWWQELRESLGALAQHSLQWDNELGMVRGTIQNTRHHFGAILPDRVFDGVQWTTAHADLHWANLRQPQFCILDWESWRPAFAGYDLATLYCNSLLHPPTAERIRAMAGLRTLSGKLALLSAICRYLWVAGNGSDWDRLEGALRAEGDAIISELT